MKPTGKWSLSTSFRCDVKFGEADPTGILPSPPPNQLEARIDIDYNEGVIRLALIPTNRDDLGILVNDSKETNSCKNIVIGWTGDVAAIRHACRFFASAIDNMYWISENIKTEGE